MAKTKAVVKKTTRRKQASGSLARMPTLQKHGTRQPQKPYNEMNFEELADATKDLDKPGILFKGKNPLSKKVFDKWAENERRRGRPPIGEGAQPVRVTIERSLLEAVDKAAREQATTRSALIARGLRMVLKTKVSR